MTQPPKSHQHQQRMARKKAVINANIARADQERGIVLVHTGNGKGKSSSAFGMVARALGHKMQVGVVQFIKGATSTGEEQFFRRFPEQVHYHVMGEGFTWDTQDKSRDITAAQQGWSVACELLTNPEIRLVILDELNLVLKYHYLEIDSVLEVLKARPPMQHVVITGRAAPQAIIDYADTVTEMRDVKHAYRAGIKAQPGVEL